MSLVLLEYIIFLTTFKSLWFLMNTNALGDPLTHLITKPKSILLFSLSLVWILSPLGSQGTLRLVRRSESTNVFDHGIRYWDSGPLGNLFPYSWSCVHNDGGYPASTRDTYLAALMQGSKTKKGTQDQWGNVKIPRLPDSNSSKPDPDGWFPGPRGTVNPEQYSSLTGIPIIGLNKFDKEEVSFTVETSYVDLVCQEMVPILDEAYGFNVTCPDCGRECAPDQYGRAGAFLGPPFSGLTAAEQTNASVTKPRSILFNSRAASSNSLSEGYMQAACQVTQRLVETFVECIGNNCTATKIRPSKTDHRSSNYTSFDYWGIVALSMISRTIQGDPSAEDVGKDHGPSTSELFLNDSNILPYPSNKQLLSQGAISNLYSFDIDVFARRASTLLNTALQAFMCPSCFAGDFPSNLSLYGPAHLPADGLTVATNAFNWTQEQAFDGKYELINEQIPFMAASTNAKVVRRIEVYQPNYGWIGVLAGSVAVVFLLGLSGLCLRFATIIPDVFDPVIGLTYSNEYMPSTSVQGQLDSEDRLKSAADERVKLGAVEHEDMQARVVFGEEKMISPLNRETWYYESSPR